MPLHIANYSPGYTAAPSGDADPAKAAQAQPAAEPAADAAAPEAVQPQPADAAPASTEAPAVLHGDAAAADLQFQPASAPPAPTQDAALGGDPGAHADTPAPAAGDAPPLTPHQEAALLDAVADGNPAAIDMAMRFGIVVVWQPALMGSLPAEWLKEILNRPATILQFASSDVPPMESSDSPGGADNRARARRPLPRPAPKADEGTAGADQAAAQASALQAIFLRSSLNAAADAGAAQADAAQSDALRASDLQGHEPGQFLTRNQALANLLLTLDQRGNVVDVRKENAPPKPE